jgi:cell division septation protein DedD
MPIFKILFCLISFHSISQGALTQEEIRLGEAVGVHASQGRWTEALEIAEKLSGPLRDLTLAKLELSGELSARLLNTVSDSGKTGHPLQRSEAWYRLGQYQYARGAYHLAIPAFRFHLSRDPDGPLAEAARYAMGMACLLFTRSREGKEAYLDTGKIYLEPLLKHSQGTYRVLGAEAAARIALERGQKKAALQTVQSVLESAPQDEEAALLLLGIEALEKDDPQEASNWAKQLSRFPLSPEWSWLKTNRPQWTQLPIESKSTQDLSERRVQPKSKEEKKDSGYVLQFGAFEAAPNAKALQSKLLASKIPAKVVEEGGWHKVKAGSFPDAEKARNQADRWEALAGIKVHVLPQ